MTCVTLHLEDMCLFVNNLGEMTGNCNDSRLLGVDSGGRRVVATYSIRRVETGCLIAIHLEKLTLCCEDFVAFSRRSTAGTGFH